MYERYKTIRTKQEFFDSFDEENLGSMNQKIRELVYNKYFVKSAVLQRDDFTCRNEICSFCDNVKESINLTIHHIKFQKNEGEDKLKNCITICKGAHKSFHSGRTSLTFNGHTYRLHNKDKLNWKKIKKESKSIRKEHKQYHGIKISWEMILELMKWLDEIN